jgi:hypothetical protein
VPKYTVYMPVTGRIAIEVEADTKKAAVEAAWDVEVDWKDPDLDFEFEMVEHVVTGNVTHAMLNDVFVEVSK